MRMLICSPDGANRPTELALEFDNPGLLIEPDHAEIKRVLVALDCTASVANEAAEWGADLVLTHHPPFFTPCRSFTATPLRLPHAY